MTKITLPTMTCGHGVRTVTSAVQRVDASAAPQMGPPRHRVSIQRTQPAGRFAAAPTKAGHAPA